ncbi:MAG: ATP synthase F0 subunit B [Candidatus Aminicenantaceae bacterium]
MLAVDATLLIVFFIVWILLFTLKKVFFKPFRNIMTRREETIESNLKASEEAKNRYETNIRKVEDSLKAARLAAKETQEQFTADALRDKEQMILEIGQECRAKVNEAKEQLEKKVEELKKDLASESKVLSEKIEQRLIH